VASVEEATGGGRAPRRGLTRREFLATGAGTAAGLFLLKESLLPATAVGRNASFSRAPVSNLVATGLEQSRLEEAAKKVHFESPLANARLKPTPRTRRRHVALIHLESTRERSVTPYNGDLLTMPYLAGLTRDSLLVERAYTTIPHTSKAITSVNSGLYPSPATDIVEATPGRIPARCLAELLAEQGYATAWFQSATQTFEDRPKLVANFGYEHFQAFESMKTEGFQRSNYLGDLEEPEGRGTDGVGVHPLREGGPEVGASRHACRSFGGTYGVDPGRGCVERLRSLFQLEGPGVACLTLRARHAPLIRIWGWARAFSHEIHRRAIRLEGYGLGGTPVVLQALGI
jgi:hypothetical protein